MKKFFSSPKKDYKKIALIDENLNKITYSTLYKKADQISKHISNNSVTLLVADNSFEFIAGYLALMNKNKVIKIILDSSFSNDYIKKIINLYKPKYIFLPKLFELKNVKFEKCKNFKSYRILLRNNKKLKVNYKNFLLLSTSGTTHSPKFVRLSKKNIEDNTKKIIKCLKIKKDHTTITTMPAGYSYGLSIINTHLKSGARIVLNKNSILEKQFWNKIKNFKVNSFGGVPEFYDFLKKIDFSKYICKSLKYLTQAGGKLDEKNLRYFGEICKKNKIKFYVMYGQTEASPRISYLEWKYFFKKINSVGKPLFGYSIKLFKNKKEIKKKNQVGELVIKGENVSLGYANSLIDLNKGDANKKILFTGDLGFKDNENFYYITDRVKRFIKIFGKRYNLNEIENFLKGKGFKIRCKPADKKLSLEMLDKESSSGAIIDILSKKYSINKNYIMISNIKKSFKDYK
tara:strand:- start:3579 stop:4955 length:1377 start_codon:yes stop_codon:yes gene_type:complete